MTGTTDQTLKNRLKERAKLVVRGGLQRLDLDLRRGSYAGQVARTLSARGITDVLDIGANVGQFAVGLRRAGFEGQIVSCEPLSGAHAELSKRAAHDDAWHPVRAAVGRVTGELEINVAGNSYSSSLLPMAKAHLDDAPESAYVAVERVPVTTVVDLVERFAISPERTLLKVDTQGFESEVLAGAGELLDRFDAVQLELSFVELYDGQALAEDLVAELRSHGFRLQALEPGMTSTTGRLLQCDALVVRSDDER